MARTKDRREGMRKDGRGEKCVISFCDPLNFPKLDLNFS
jgi:hypothetical protein